MTSDLGHHVSSESRPAYPAKDPAGHLPVSSDSPVDPPARLSPFGPSHQELVQCVVNLLEGCGAAHRPIIGAPPPDYRVQGFDERRLRCAPQVVYYFGQSLGVAFRPPLARLDDGLEPERPSFPSSPTVVFPYRALPDGEPKEVNPRHPVHLVQGMADTGFARLQFQAHAFEPFLGYGLTSPYYLFIAVQDDEVVGVPDYCRSPRCWSFPTRQPFAGRVLGPDLCFQAVKGNVRQQG